MTRLDGLRQWEPAELRAKGSRALRKILHPCAPPYPQCFSVSVKEKKRKVPCFFLRKLSLLLPFYPSLVCADLQEPCPLFAQQSWVSLGPDSTLLRHQRQNVSQFLSESIYCSWCQRTKLEWVSEPGCRPSSKLTALHSLRSLFSPHPSHNLRQRSPERPSFLPTERPPQPS